MSVWASPSVWLLLLLLLLVWLSAFRLESVSELGSELALQSLSGLGSVLAVEVAVSQKP
jgi:hypothetical protein